MTKLNAGLITPLPASDSGSAAVWGSKRINPRTQSCLCLAWSGYPSNDDDDDEETTKEKKEAKKAWDKVRDENIKKIYKEKNFLYQQAREKSQAKKAVAMAKGRAYDNLYARLETKEGEKELYRLARQRDRAGKDVQHVRVIKDKNGNVMVNSEAVLNRWEGVL